MSFTYEALDRTHCIINNIDVNLVQHRFYTDNEEYRKLVDTAIEALSEAYQIAGRVDYEQDDGIENELVCKVAQIQDLKGENSVLQQRHSRLENECLQLKTKLSNIAQMNWWKRIVFIFKGCE